jgi:CHAT domain-containing protein
VGRERPDNARFLERFYRQLSQGETPATALRSAKLVMIRDGPRITAHPYFWAPFALEAAPE